ncbi:MAG: hypothetical protein Q9190_002515 [Brigantiaea leucoxantha]
MLKKPSVVLSTYANIHSVPYSHQTSSRRSRIVRHGFATVHGGKSASDDPERFCWPHSNSSDVPSPYQILRLRKTEPYSKRRFYELVKLYHPDRCHHDCKIGAVDSLPIDVKLKRYRLVIAAHDILSDPTRRQAYDQYGAGWHEHPDVGGTEQTRNKWDFKAEQRWTGFHGHDSPANNATWEDWENWYHRNDKQPQSAMYLSNDMFISLVAVCVTLGAVFQINRIEDRKTEMVEETNRACGMAIQDRKTRIGGLGGREALVREFVRSREDSGIQNADDAGKSHNEDGKDFVSITN